LDNGNTIGILYIFLERARSDPGIGPTHISLFAALLYFYQQQGFCSPMRVFSRDLLGIAKMSSRTYHACMSDLIKGKYIKYEASFNPAKGSLIYLS